MITAILYTSNSGYTKRYAEMLAAKTGLPAYNTANSIPPQTRGKPVIYMGWLMAGTVQGYAKAAKHYDIRALCPVGMAPPEQDQCQEIIKRQKLAIPVFYLQGGFDMKRLHGIYKMMMGLMRKKIQADMDRAAQRSKQQEDMLEMVTQGKSCVDEANLAQIENWLSANQ